MFERFNEPARRSLFFSRYEASVLGDHAIEPHHLLLGILKVQEPLLLHLVGGAEASESLKAAIHERASRGEPLAVSVEIPFSHDAKQILECAAEEAERLLHRHVGPEHLLLGLLRLDRGLTRDILGQHGLALESSRDALVMRVSATVPLPRELEGLVATILPGQAPPRRVPGLFFVMTVLDGPSPGRRPATDDGVGASSSGGIVAFATRADRTPDGRGHAIGPISLANVTLPQFARALEAFLGAPVVVEDKDMSGTFDIELHGEYRDVPALATALREQLGLELNGPI